MPYSSQRDLTGKHPLDVFPFLVMADGTGSLYDGTGSQITSLNVTASQAISASFEIIYETSSSYANFADSSSFSVSASFSSASISSSYADFAKSASYGDFSKSSSYADFSKSGSSALFSISSSFTDFAKSASYGDFATSASHSDFSKSGSNAQTSSYISPSFGAVSDVSNATGSSVGTAGFTDAAELGAFILAVSSSFQTLNSLIDKLQAAGVIS